MGLFVYHLVPDGMLGTILYPLNQLKKKYPAAYDKHSEKYRGREWLADRVIPPLNCLWNDVLFLCPVHPGKILGTLREIGYDHPRERFFEIDTGQLTNDKFAVLTYPDDGGDPQYHHQGPNSMPGIDDLPSVTVNYFKESFANKKRFMLFAYIPHVLYLGSVDVSQCPIIEV